MINDELPTEQCKQSELRVGDVVKQGGLLPWVLVKSIQDIPEDDPAWKYGRRIFTCESIGEDGQHRALITFESHDDHTITRRAYEPD